MWIHDEIKRSLEAIDPDSIRMLDRIDALPHEMAVAAAAYLLQNCSDTDNDIWYVSCRGLLWRIPYSWVECNLTEILGHMEIDWADDFMYANLCAAYFHVPEILERLITVGKEEGADPDVLEWAENFEKMLPEGSREYYDRTMELFEVKYFL